MSFFETLQQETQADRAKLLAAPIIGLALEGKASLAQYIAFLTQAYHHVKHTLPLLMTCGGRIPAEKEWLRTAIAHYIAEETGHQEWILNDIRTCGGDAEAVRHGKPNRHTELMVSYAYDTILRNNPCGFFGMVFVLEGTSVALAVRAAGTLKQSLGLPDTAFTYLTSHGSLDTEHVKFLQDVLNRLEGDDDRQAVIHCAKMFFYLYGNIFRSLTEDGASA